MTKQMDGCALSAQFNGTGNLYEYVMFVTYIIVSNCAAGGIPYKVLITGINGRNEAVETALSNIFFTNQKGTPDKSATQYVQ